MEIEIYTHREKRERAIDLLKFLFLINELYELIEWVDKF